MRRSLVGALTIALGLVTGIPSAASTGPAEQRWIVEGSPASVAAAPGVDDVRATRSGHLVVEATPAAAAALAADPAVRWVEPDVEFRASADPDDPLYPQQAELRQANVPAAWNSATFGVTGTVVAVVDSGVQTSHPDLSGVVVPGIDIVNQDSDAEDDHGHGTAVTGVLAARMNNGRGIAGVCGLCRIMPVKVLDENGVGVASDIADGIDWAVDHGAKVINLSIAGQFPSLAVEDAVARARDAGAVIFAAAGNEGSTVPTYPANTPGVHAVAGVDADDQLYGWSNRGSWVDFAAPGCPRTTLPGATWDVICGTSFSTPFLSGTAALARTADHLVTDDELTSALAQSAAPVGPGVVHGRVDADDTLALLRPGIGRASGETRVLTSVQVSQHTFPLGAPAVVIATRAGYADALASAPLAGQLGGPTLLTNPNGLPTEVANEIRRLGATNGVIVGGREAVSRDVEEDLAAAGITDIDRVSGTNRFETAAAITALVVEDGPPGPVRVFVTEGINPDPGRGWPDAVAVSGLAAFVERGLLLVRQGTAPAATRQALLDFGVAEATIVGGETSVSAAAEAMVADPDGDGSEEVEVGRIAGEDRYDTSAKVADTAIAAGATAESIWFATGTFWADALTAGATGAPGTIVLLVNGSRTTTPPIDAWLDAHQADLRWLRIAGGTAAVSRPAAEHLDGVISS